MKYRDRSAAALRTLSARCAALATDLAGIARDGVVSHIVNAPPRSGATYTDPVSGRRITRSAPGEAPASSGPYVESWKVEAAEANRDRCVAAAYSDLADEDGLPLGLTLEFTSDRPHIRPALPAIIEGVKARVREGL